MSDHTEGRRWLTVKFYTAASILLLSSFVVQRMDLVLAVDFDARVSNPWLA